MAVPEVSRQTTCPKCGYELGDREAVAPLKEALRAMIAHEVYSGICHACGNGVKEHMPECPVLKAEAALRGGGD